MKNIVCIIFLRQCGTARSEQTLTDLIAAARDVLDEKDFDGASVAEIAARAGVTVGAFYARFADMDSLLWYLEEAAYDALDEALAPCCDPLVPEETFAQRMAMLFEALTAFYLAHRGVVRALADRARRDPRLAERRRARSSRLFRQGREWILAHHPVGEKLDRDCVDSALLTATAAIRERTLTGDYLPDPEPLQGAALAREVARMVSAYLAQTAEER